MTFSLLFKLRVRNGYGQILLLYRPFAPKPSPLFFLSSIGPGPVIVPAVTFQAEADEARSGVGGVVKGVGGGDDLALHFTAFIDILLAVECIAVDTPHFRLNLALPRLHLDVVRVIGTFGRHGRLLTLR